MSDALRSLGGRAEQARPEPVRDFVVRLPAWVESYGVARLGEWWLLLLHSGEDEDVAGEDGPRAGDVGAFCVSQAVLDLPEGRYTVEAFDVRSGVLLSRESAAAPPLVVGVPRWAATAMLTIEAVGPAGPRRERAGGLGL